MTVQHRQGKLRGGVIPQLSLELVKSPRCEFPKGLPL